MTRDRGLQAERTALAWRRTALAVCVGACATAKVLAGDLSAGALVLALAGLAWSVDLGAISRRRYRMAREALAHEGPTMDGSHLKRTATILLVTAMMAPFLTILLAQSR